MEIEKRTISKEEKELTQLIAARTAVWAAMKTQTRSRLEELQKLSTGELLSLTRGAAIFRRELFERMLETYRNYTAMQTMVENLDTDVSLANTLLGARLSTEKKAQREKEEASQKELAKLLKSKGISLDQLKTILTRGGSDALQDQR